MSVLSSAGFGRRTTWSSASNGPEPDSHHSINLSKALKTPTNYLLLKALTPTFVHTLCQTIHIPWLTQALNETTLALESLRGHMLEIVSDDRAERTPGGKMETTYPASKGTKRPKEIKSGLLANLVEVNMAHNEDNVPGEKSKTLTDAELLSDTFVCSQTVSYEGIWN
jgi:hypothetical protein